jgi:polar amino acid transport system substrate-binding protein
MKTLTLATAALAFTAGVAFAGDTVRLGTEGAYPPWNFLNDAGEVDGFEREVGDELCKRANLTCEWVINDWDSMIPKLKNEDFDAIIAGMSITDDRKEKIDFTTNYTQPDPSKHLALSADADLASGVIAAQSNTIQSGYIASSGATLVEFSTPEETIAAVRNGEADAVLADKSYLAPFAAENADLMLVGEDIMLGGGVGMGIRKSNSDLKAKFTAAIDSMKADGSLNALITKWEIGAKF